MVNVAQADQRDGRLPPAAGGFEQRYALQECFDGLIPAPAGAYAQDTTDAGECVRDAEFVAQAPVDGEAAPHALQAVSRVLARSEEHTSELQSLRHLVCR